MMSLYLLLAGEVAGTGQQGKFRAAIRRVLADGEQSLLYKSLIDSKTKELDSEATSITALAFVLTLGDVKRFKRGKQVSSYLGLIPREHSSSSKQRLGSISKQGNSFLRMLLVESAQSVTRLDEGFRKQYQRRCHHMAKGVAKVAAARRLAVRLFWMLRTNTAYPEIVRIESSPAEARVGGS